MSKRDNQTDVMIIGGGIMGSATALDLVRHSNLSVRLIDKSQCGSQASQSNFGNVRFYGWQSDQMPIAIRARGIWLELEELLGDRCEFAQHGSLKVAFNGTDFDELVEYAENATGYDFGFELLRTDELKSRFPWLHGSAGAMFSPQDGTANPRLVAARYALAAASKGVDVVEDCEISRLEKNNGRFIANSRDGRSFQSTIVVNCAGAWGNHIAAEFGEHVPMQVRGPQIVVSEPVTYFIEPMISCISPIYFRQTPRGNIIVGGGNRNEPDLDKSLHWTNPDNMQLKYRELTKVVPDLRGIRFIRGWSGIEGYVEDSLPVISWSQAVDGLLHCFGFSGSGFQLAPAIGEIVSELIRHEKSNTPIDAFSIGRFDPNENSVPVV